MKYLGLLMATGAAIIAVAPANAALLTFTVTGGTSLTFQLDSNPTPTQSLANSFTLNNQPAGNFRFYNTAASGGMQLVSGGQPLLIASGPQLFSGTLQAPQFLTGNFTLTGADGRTTYSLNIAPATAAVPEPASWALMVGGFGAVGFAMRRRGNVKTTVSFA